MSRTWPPRPASRALPPGPRQDVFALIDRYAPVIATWPAYDRWRVRQIAVDTLLLSVVRTFGTTRGVN